MAAHSIDPRRFSSRTLVLVGSLAFALLVVSYVVDVRIIVTTPNVGDVTGLLGTIWRAVLALATIASFLLALSDVSTGDRPSDGPRRTFEIRGENHDIDLHLHWMDPRERGKRPEGTADGRSEEQPHERESDESREPTRQTGHSRTHHQASREEPTDAEPTEAEPTDAEPTDAESSGAESTTEESSDDETTDDAG